MKLFLSLVSYFPAIFQGIIAIQQAIAGAPGATKKQILLSSVKAAAAVGESIPESHIAGISTMADGIVTLLHTTNMAGFGTSQPATAGTQTVTITATAAAGTV